MCGIFGVIAPDIISKKELKLLVKHSQQRGKDSSGLIFFKAFPRITVNAKFSTKVVNSISCSSDISLILKFG